MRMKNEITLNDECPKMKQCSKCKVEKPATTEFFYAHKGHKDGLKGQCRDCFNASQAEHYLNPEIRENVLAYQAERWLNLGVRKAKRIYDIERSLDPEIHEKQRISRKAYSTTDQGRNVNRAITQRYRAKKFSLPSTFTVEDWHICQEFFNYKCAYCGSVDASERDHFIPLTSKSELCLGTVAKNIVPACRHCNASKNNKSPYVWATNEVLEHIKVYFASLI